MSHIDEWSWESMKGNLQPNAISERKTFEADSRFWKISKDAQGLGTAVIRILPDKNKKAFAQVYHYSLQKTVGGKKIYYIAESPETIGAPCPVKEHFDKLMSEGTEESKKFAIENFKRQIKFVSNILVIKDPANPDNNGKVFLWEYGTKFRDKIFQWMSPSEDSINIIDEPENADEMTPEEIHAYKKRLAEKRIMNPVDGHNIKLVAAPNGTMINGRLISVLDTSEAMPTSGPAVKGLTGKNALQWITDNTYDLNEFLSPEHFESYEVLKKRFDYYMGTSVPKAEASAAVAKVASAPVADDWDEAPVSAPKEKVSAVSSASTVDVGEEDDSWMNDIMAE